MPGTFQLWNGKFLLGQNGKMAVHPACCCSHPCECNVWYDQGYGTINGTYPPFTDEYDPAIKYSYQNLYVDAPIFLKLLNANDFLRSAASWDGAFFNKTSGRSDILQDEGRFGESNLTLRYNMLSYTPNLTILSELRCFGEGEHSLTLGNDAAWYTFNGPAWTIEILVSFYDEAWAWPHSFEVRFAKLFNKNCDELGHPTPQLINAWDSYRVVFYGSETIYDWPLDGDMLPELPLYYRDSENTLFEWATPEIEIVDNPFP